MCRQFNLMQILRDLRELTPNQRNAVLACFLGWTLDAFDFFIIVFVLNDIAKEFKTDFPAVTATLFLTLAMRPLGAFKFGIAADRFGPADINDRYSERLGACHHSGHRGDNRSGRDSFRSRATGREIRRSISVQFVSIRNGSAQRKKHSNSTAGEIP